MTDDAGLFYISSAMRFAHSCKPNNGVIRCIPRLNGLIRWHRSRDLLVVIRPIFIASAPLGYRSMSDRAFKHTDKFCRGLGTPNSDPSTCIVEIRCQSKVLSHAYSKYAFHLGDRISDSEPRLVAEQAFGRAMLYRARVGEDEVILIVFDQMSIVIR